MHLLKNYISIFVVFLISLIYHAFSRSNLSYILYIFSWVLLLISTLYFVKKYLSKSPHYYIVIFLATAFNVFLIFLIEIIMMNEIYA